MRRLMVDGPLAGTIKEWDYGPMVVAVTPPMRFEEIEKTHYYPFDVFDPGDELTGRAPGKLFVMVWEDSPRFNEYRSKLHAVPAFHLNYVDESSCKDYGISRPHPNCRSTMKDAMGPNNPGTTLREMIEERVVEWRRHDPGDKAAAVLRAEQPTPGTDFEKLRHTEPEQNDDGTITGPDGVRRFL